MPEAIPTDTTEFAVTGVAREDGEKATRRMKLNYVRMTIAERMSRSANRSRTSALKPASEATRLVRSRSS